jgi:hypothetical protein
MSLLRHNPRRDENEKPIVQALRDCGVHVYRISATGVPDLLCFFGRQVFLVEVKARRQGMDSGPASLLSKPQRAFHQLAKANGWPVYILTSEFEVLELVNSLGRTRRARA